MIKIIRRVRATHIVMDLLIVSLMGLMLSIGYLLIEKAEMAHPLRVSLF